MRASEATRTSTHELPAEVRLRPAVLELAELRVDPAFKALCPPLQPSERVQLEANLLVDGCRERLIVWREPPDGRWLIVDGHNRFEICTRLGIPFGTVELLLEYRDEVCLWIIDNQLGRRNLPDGARALLALEYEEAEKRLAAQRQIDAGRENAALGGRVRAAQAERDGAGQFVKDSPALVSTWTQGLDGADDEPQERPPVSEPATAAVEPGDAAPTGMLAAQPAKRRGQKEPPSDKPPEEVPPNKKREPTSRERAAKKGHIGAGSVARAKYVKDRADEDTILNLMSGKTNINREHRRLKEEEKRRELEHKMAVVVASLRPEDLAVRCCSMQELLSRMDERSLDAIITDAPYPREFLSLYGDLARLAKPVLKPEGVLAVMVGQSYLPEILALMTQHIEYRWTLAYLTPGGQAVQLWQRKVNTFWKPVLVFGGAGRWTGDVVKSDANDNDKRFHNWGQSESGMARLVERLTEPGDLVCDPFAGGGTTGVVCAALGRRFVGCDIEEKSVSLANARILDSRKERTDG
jgi:hypothetical protein